MDPVLVLFMWAGGAEFEKKLVKYEYDPTYSLQLPLSIVDINGTSGMLFDDAAAASTVIENPSVSALPYENGSIKISEPISTS